MAKRNRILLLCLAAVLLLLAGCAKEQTEEPAQEEFAGLVCLEYSRYSGYFPEDGTNRELSDVAAMKIRNTSDQYLDYALIECRIGNRTGTFKATGIPPGATAWVLEESGMSVSEGETFIATACDEYYFRPDAVLSTDKVSVRAWNGVLRVTNESDHRMENLCLYYKTVHPDGNYFGGITYMAVCDTLEPGETAKVETAHFGDDSEIVRYSWQES